VIELRTVPVDWIRQYQQDRYDMECRIRELERERLGMAALVMLVSVLGWLL
jgi:hypothetical protein